MAVVPIFSGRVTEDGKLLLTPSEHTARASHLRTLAGRDVEVIVRKKRTQRSTAQNSWIHAAASLLAEHCGNSLAEQKLDLMGECWGWRTLSNGHTVPMKIHTSDMTVEEASQFIDWLIRWSAEKFPEVKIPLPGQAEAA